MRARKIVVASFLIFLAAYANGQQEQRFVLLPASEARNLAEMYPKDGPEKINGSWQPTKSQIESLEANLHHVSDLKSFGAPKSERIEHPEQYFRQYLAVVRDGQNLIYINSFCQIQNISNWRNHIAIVMDGGTCFWQARYDPATERFLNLYINGRA
ncbi:MAG: hypothetical protein ABSE55_03145 [Terracidiphilus sp.]|jgi:hypothetical protein